MTALEQLATYTSQYSGDILPERIMVAPVWVEALRAEGNHEHIEEACAPEGWHWVRLVLTGRSAGLNRELEIQKEIWRLMAELRELHTARTGHPVWTHRRLWDTATSCFECSGVTDTTGIKNVATS